MNDLLKIELKNFLRIVVKRPGNMSKKDYQDLYPFYN